jgi:hypothetical protein
MDFILPCQAKAFLFSMGNENSSQESVVMNISLPLDFYQGRNGAKRKNPARRPSEALKQKQITKHLKEGDSYGAKQERISA